MWICVFELYSTHARKEDRENEIQLESVGEWFVSCPRREQFANLLNNAKITNIYLASLGFWNRSFPAYKSMSLPFNAMYVSVCVCVVYSVVLMVQHFQFNTALRMLDNGEISLNGIEKDN